LECAAAAENGARMSEAVILTPERILEATEDVLRRFGLATRFRVPMHTQKAKGGFPGTCW